MFALKFIVDNCNRECLKELHKGTLLQAVSKTNRYTVYRLIDPECLKKTDAASQQ